MRQREAVQSDNGPERRLHDAFLIAPATIANRQTANLARTTATHCELSQNGNRKMSAHFARAKRRTIAQKGPLATATRH